MRCSLEVARTNAKWFASLYYVVERWGENLDRVILAEIAIARERQIADPGAGGGENRVTKCGDERRYSPLSDTPNPSLELDRSILLKHLVSPARHTENIRTRGRSEREAHGENQAMVVLVELRRGDLDTSTKAEMEPLRKWKGAEHESRRQKHFLLAV